MIVDAAVLVPIELATTTTAHNDGEGSVSTGTGSLSGQSHRRAASSWAYGRAFFANEAAVTLASSRLGDRAAAVFSVLLSSIAFCVQKLSASVA
jgi:hypothetical protein